MTEFEPLPQPPAPRRGRRVAVTVGLVGAGIAAGAIVASTIGAGAETTSSTAAASSSASGAPAPGTDHGGRRPRGNMSWLTGTVTTVTSNSVTIKTSTATTTYGVTSASDIDKFGEAKLSDLKVGDAVRFTTMTASGKTIIDKLHAGDETKNMPAGPPNGARPGQAAPSNGASGEVGG